LGELGAEGEDDGACGDDVHHVRPEERIGGDMML
jgi:hypothetical protein